MVRILLLRLALQRLGQEGRRVVLRRLRRQDGPRLGEGQRLVLHRPRVRQDADRGRRDRRQELLARPRQGRGLRQVGLGRYARGALLRFV